MAWQCNVTRIAAPTGNEGQRARWMAAQFAACGWTAVEIDSTGNVIARQPHGAATRAPARDIWCVAHLDTVFDDAAPLVHRAGTRLTGPGICDNGRGLAALLAIAGALQAHPIPALDDLVLIASVGEEGRGDLRGMRALLVPARAQPRAVIAIDGAGDDRIVHLSVGSKRLRIVCRGPGGHSWAHAGAPNPVHVISRIAAALDAVVVPRTPRSSLAVTRIGGGESINSIPRDAWMEVDVRSTSGDVLAALVQTVTDTVARQMRTAAPDTLTHEIIPIGDRPCGFVPAEHPVVSAAAAATRTVGVRPQLAMGSTDASIPMALGIPAIAVGAGGSGGGTHTPDEWYDDTDGVRGLHRLLHLLVGVSASVR